MQSLSALANDLDGIIRSFRITRARFGEACEAILAEGCRASLDSPLQRRNRCRNNKAGSRFEMQVAQSARRAIAMPEISAFVHEVAQFQIRDWCAP